MNCAQLSKDLGELKASRDAMRKCFDSAKETHRGRVVLKETVNSYEALSDDILSEYLDDFEKQYPDKWIRDFREIEKPNEATEGWLKQYISQVDRDTPHFQLNTTYDDVVSEEWRIISDARDQGIDHLIINYKTDKDEDYPPYDYESDIYCIGDDRLIAIITDFTVLPNDENRIRIYFYTSGLVPNLDISTDFCCYTTNPSSLLQLDNHTIAIGGQDGRIVLMVEKEDGSWDSADSVTWEGGDVSKMVLLENKNIAVYNRSNEECAIIRTANDLWALKECIHKFTRKEDE